MWTIVLYEKENGEVPVKEFINSLAGKLKGKAIREIRLLREYGTALKEPYSKALQGNTYKGLWELRIRIGSDASRIFYFLTLADTFVLLHGFLKKSEETPRRELELAKRYMEDYERRFVK